MGKNNNTVNVYTSTKTELYGQRGVSLQTVDYIWECRRRHLVIDSERVLKMNPHGWKMLNFSYPGQKDDESCCLETTSEQDKADNMVSDKFHNVIDMDGYRTIHETSSLETISKQDKGENPVQDKLYNVMDMDTIQCGIRTIQQIISLQGNMIRDLIDELKNFKK